MSTALEIDSNLTYCPKTLVVSQPLNITNVSGDELVYKVKTNKKNYISMNPCNGFLKPFASLAIPVKIVENVPQNVAIKLQVDWCIATPQIKQKNDIKMATVNEKDLFKKVFPIVRKQSQGTSFYNKAASEQAKPSLYTSVLSESQKSGKQQNKITPFEYEKKQLLEEKDKQSPKKAFPFKEEVHKEESQDLTESIQKHHSANHMLDALSSPSKNLEIVSQEDEEDHEKELEQIRNEQVNERRKIDELESKVRKINQEVKSTEIIQPQILFLLLAGSFLTGSLIQYLIF